MTERREHMDLQILTRLFEIDLDHVEMGLGGGGFTTAWGVAVVAFDIDTIRENMESLLGMNLSPQLNHLAEEGIGYWHQGFFSPTEVPELARCLREILGELNELEEH